MIGYNTLGFICRKNIPYEGGARISTYGAGICIAPDGSILTARHVLENFVLRYSPYDTADAVRLTREGGYVPVEEQEGPHFAFYVSLGKGGSPEIRPGWRTLPLFRFQSTEYASSGDVALGWLDLPKGYPPLPFIQINPHRPAPGDVVKFLGHFHPPEAPKDSRGLPLGFAVAFWSARVVYSAREYFLLDIEVVT
jgi:hypothetical protein